ncbi:excinuclease ABC subunit UvrA [Candidatus Babeliales bacterium]|nr:excinuclease ABC subunit UvrA [Candidatus Babeliales bacterium]
MKRTKIAAHEIASASVSSKRQFRDWITIVGAREHNLKNITVRVPKGTLTVVTGPSGSGKSSLTLDILFTEGKRRYMESLSSYARQFLGIARRPDVDVIEGLCPSIAIEQKTVGSNPRSTVGTITEIYDYLRVLFARVGRPRCPECKTPIQPESPDAITSMIMDQFKGLVITISAPIVHAKKGEFVHQLVDLFQKGFYRFRVDGMLCKFKVVDEIKKLKLEKTYKHTIDLLIDSVAVEDLERGRINEAVEKSFEIARGMCKITVGDQEYLYSSSRMCLNCAQSFPELEPRFFSFNSPVGACDTCNGLGVTHEWPWDKNDPEAWRMEYPEYFLDKYATEHTCPGCMGKRLNKHALSVTVGGKDIMELGDLSIEQALVFFNDLSLSSTETTIAEGAVREIIRRLTFLEEVGLGYLSINRTARTLSGGEGQRIRLATQIGSALSGVLYILDEPSIGLHQRDNDRLIQMLKRLRDQGNTVLVVEHDLDTIRQADYVIDMGPAAGVHGGQVIAAGTPDEIALHPLSLTGSYVAGVKSIPVPRLRRRPKGWLVMRDCSRNNLKNIDVSIPLGVICGVSGVSGSGKSSLIMEELAARLHRELMRPRRDADHSPVDTSANDLEGADMLGAMVVIDQSPIGRTPRSNPATYLGVFDQIRTLFSQLPESKARGFKPGRFSFNVKAGRCFECDGDGVKKVSMQFMPDVVMTCKICRGKRYNAETLAITYKGKNIADILAMTATEALPFFEAHKHIAKRLQLMCDVGLGYVQLGQPSTTLSGGEAQRIKLVDELAKRGNETLYILDEPTTGLHNSDIEKLLMVLKRLVDKGNSMIIIEHNLDVLKTVDYLIDLGPEGGDKGGMVVAEGSPTKVALSAHSHTGLYLKAVLS